MNVPMSWLKQYVDIDVDTKTFIDAMTMSGSKVEAVEESGKEITKVLIGELHNAKRHQIEQWEMITTNINLSQYSKEDANDYINKVENRYYCSAYNCLCALIKLTQTKVEIFNKFFFDHL